jgi:hypothetical protein
LGLWNVEAFSQYFILEIALTHPGENFIVVAVLCDGVSGITRYNDRQVVYSGTQVEDTFGNKKHADLDTIQPEGTSSSPEECVMVRRSGGLKKGVERTVTPREKQQRDATISDG